nr:hypothetical protein [Chitinophaga sedimenti]
MILNFEKLSQVFFNILKFVMKLAPIGAFGAWPLPSANTA